MNVLITTGIFPPEVGGPATYVPEIIKRLKDRIAFKILTFTSHPTEFFSDVPIISISKAGGFFARQWRLFQLIFAQKSWLDVIYTQDPLIVGLTSVLAGRFLGKKVVIRYGGDPAWEAAFGQGRTKKLLLDFLRQPDGGTRAKLDVFLTRLSFNLVDKIITNSMFLKNVVRDLYKISARKITVVHNAIEVGSFPNKRLTKKKVFLALSFGRLVSWKKYNQIIEAVARINERGKIKVKLLIFGDGPERENLKKMGKGFLELLPAKSHRESLEFLRRADVYILNSLYEGSPNQVIEAFSVGTPVVATNIPGTNEVAINNRTALTIPPGNTTILAEAIERILTHPKLANRLAQNGFNLLYKKFNWNKTIQQLEIVLGR